MTQYEPIPETDNLFNQVKLANIEDFESEANSYQKVYKWRDLPERKVFILKWVQKLKTKFGTALKGNIYTEKGRFFVWLPNRMEQEINEKRLPCKIVSYGLVPSKSSNRSYFSYKIAPIRVRGYDTYLIDGHIKDFEIEDEFFEHKKRAEQAFSTYELMK